MGYWKHSFASETRPTCGRVNSYDRAMKEGRNPIASLLSAAEGTIFHRPDRRVWHYDDVGLTSNSRVGR